MQLRIFGALVSSRWVGACREKAEIPNRSACRRLTEDIDDLLFREFRPLQGSTLFVEDRRSRQSRTYFSKLKCDTLSVPLRGRRQGENYHSTSG